MGKNYVMFLAITCFMALVICGSAAADQTVIPASMDQNLTVSNDNGARFNANENITGLNNTYNFFNSSSQSAQQGQNALHLSANNSTDAGGVVFVNSSSGVFYMSDTGGRGWNDNGILMIAINGTIPDNFYVIITASGYQWVPLDYNLHPDPANMTYVIGTVNETFTKEDFLYGLQTWKPCPTSNYPIYEGQDTSNLTNTFSIMFIDLWAGFVGPNTRSLYPDYTFIDNGMIKITYEFFNLPEGSLAAFGAYAYCQSSKQGEGVRWVNRVGGTGSSGYYVNGVSSTPEADFTANPTKGTVPLTVEFNDQSTGTNPLTYAWDFGDGSTSAEQNPTHTYTTPGTYTVKLTVTNAVGSSEKTMTILTSNTDIVAPTPTANLPSGSYNTTITVNLTAKDDLDPNPKIYYTLNGNDPTTSSTLYNGPLTIANEGKTTLKFIAVDSLRNTSPVSTLNYIIDKTAPSANATPVGGTFNTVQNVNLTATDNLDTNTTIYYTTDGTNPTTSSTRYTTPITINGLGNVILKFAALDAAGNWSPVYTVTYNMVDVKAPVASADLPSGLFDRDQIVKLTAVDELDLHPKIYYTLDGTDPTINSTLYTWTIPINLVGTTLLKFIAVDAAGHVSNITTMTYILDKPGASGTWVSTLLDTNSMYNSIAVDASGNPHIVYYQKADSATEYPELKYAYWTGTTWHIETLESTQSGSGYYVSLVLDSSGNPHIAYSQSTPDKLKYAYKDSTGWHFFDLVNNTDVSYVNLVLYNDNPQISYFENSEERLKYIYNNGTTWVIENVTPTPTGGHWNSLALNPNGNPRIAYYDYYSSTTGILRYAKRTPTGIWQIETVDDSGDVGMWCSLVIDSLGAPHISYSAGLSGGVLKYAYYTETKWVIEVVDSLDSLASKLILDPAGNPRIVYQDVVTSNLKYAYKEGSNWIINNINTLDGAGHWLSLTCDSQGVPYVSYMSANSAIGFAYLVPFISSATPAGGVYNMTQIVTLTSNAGTTIYYTTDGSDPRTSSTKIKYTNPIPISNTIILKFAAIDSANNWGSIYTETYSIVPLNLTKDEIIAAANTVKAYIEANKSLPATVTVGGVSLNMAQFLYLATKATVAFNGGANSYSMVLGDYSLPSGSYENLNTGTMSLVDYVNFADRIASYIQSNNEAPIYGLIGLGQIGYKSQIYLYSRVLSLYGANGVLPAVVTVKSWSSDNIPISEPVVVSVTVNEILDAANTVKAYIEANKSLPNTVTVGGHVLNMAQFLYLATSATVALNNGQNTSTTISVGSYSLPSSSSENLKTGALTTNTYADFANRIAQYMAENNQAPPYGLIGLGQISYQSQIYFYSRILASYKSNGLLPTVVTIKSWGAGNIPITEVISGTYTIAQVLDAASVVKAQIESNKALPATVTIGTSTINMAQFLFLATSATNLLNSGKPLNTTLTVGSYSLPSSSYESLNTGALTVGTYVDFANRIAQYMAENNQAPPYGLMGLGQISYQSQIYLYSRILTSYKNNGTLPATITVKAWSASNIPINN
ncbi:PKD domain-containing protein [Methanobacterium formicicum DSM 3637]|uniref:PKD domain-containing protein n=2 Tax=Methanobacterium formicicum TaxID=2162 RepID=K2QGA6_METFP|nr:PKD domain-containing protein [Methanobacterium formicicum DSM 3637]